MRFIWFRLYSSDPESGTENHSLYLEWNYHSLSIEPTSRRFKLEEILDSIILLITQKWHEKETLSSYHLKTPSIPSHQPLDWSPRDRDGVSSERRISIAIHTTTRVHTLYLYIKHTKCSGFHRWGEAIDHVDSCSLLQPFSTCVGLPQWVLLQPFVTCLWDPRVKDPFWTSRGIHGTWRMRTHIAVWVVKDDYDMCLNSLDKPLCTLRGLARTRE